MQAEYKVLPCNELASAALHQCLERSASWLIRYLVWWASLLWSHTNSSSYMTSFVEIDNGTPCYLELILIEVLSCSALTFLELMLDHLKLWGVDTGIAQVRHLLIISLIIGLKASFESRAWTTGSMARLHQSMALYGEHLWNSIVKLLKSGSGDIDWLNSKSMALQQVIALAALTLLTCERTTIEFYVSIPETMC